MRHGVEAQWLIEEASAGRIPGVPAGRTWLFDPDAVEAVLLMRAQQATAGEPEQKCSRTTKEVPDAS